MFERNLEYDARHVMEPLQRLLNLATRDHLLTPINNRAAKIRLSMYEDDAAIFLNPIRDEKLTQLHNCCISLEKLQV
jgi:hypothetical protein